MPFEYLIEKGFLRDAKIRNAFLKILRHDFIPKDFEQEAEKNFSFPIGLGRQIIKPQRAAFILENLDLDEGHNILCLGSDSGWLPNLLAEVVGEEGKITAVDGISRMTEMGQENSMKYDFLKSERIRFITHDEKKGFPVHAPYDRIVSLVSFSEIPQDFKKQLKVGGKALFLNNGHYILVERKSETHFWENDEIELEDIKRRKTECFYKNKI